MKWMNLLWMANRGPIQQLETVRHRRLADQLPECPEFHRDFLPA